MIDLWFTGSKLDYGTERKAAARMHVHKIYPAGQYRIIEPEFLPWEDYVKRMGSYERVFDAVIKKADRLVVLENTLGLCGKGVFSEVRRAVNWRRPIEVIRGSAVGIPCGDMEATLIKVVDIEFLDGGDWATSYGRLVT